MSTTDLPPPRHRGTGVDPAHDAPPPTPPGPPAPAGASGPVPLPVRGLGPAALLAAGAAGVAWAVLAVGQTPGIGFALALAALVVAGGVAAHRERPLARPEQVAVVVGVVLAVQWARSDAIALLVPVTLLVVAVGAVVLAGPRTGWGHLRTIVTAPLAGLLAPLALGRGLSGTVRRRPVGLLVPVGVTIVVLVVFTSLLAGADPVFEQLVGDLVPDLDDLLVGRLVVGALAMVAVAVVALARRVVDAAPAEPVVTRPRRDWLAPVTALVALFVAFLAVQANGLFGGAARVEAVPGLTYAGYARSGVFQLLVAATLVLVVTGVVVRVAAPDDARVRDLALGALLVATTVLLASAAHRLWTYEQAYGSTRLRLAAAACLAWVLLALATVVAARFVDPVGPHAVTACVLLVAVVATAYVAIRPDAVVAERNIDRFAATGDLDRSVLWQLSADARPALSGLAAGAGSDADDDWVADADLLACPDPSTTAGLAWNLARSRAVALGDCSDAAVSGR